ncbi:hypothetical protein CARUB_v10027011mg [Capsella rubella]|uniref:Uncharacterized protein n=1 Tax=Capsella rubella TaxID=81985 RepID=R0GJW2_9BRAS|nr:uncharacterized protein LOC17875207 [Capsella rubella]EOA12585.1 hypothetical protein CARUB_v10027011mg [Capsella rubella]
MSHHRDRTRRASSSENIPHRATPPVVAVDPRRRSRTVDPAPAPRREHHDPTQRTNHAPDPRRSAHYDATRRTDHALVPQRAITVCRGPRYVAVGIEQLEAAKAEYRVVKTELDSMADMELEARIIFEQLEGQLHRAGRRFAPGELPFQESPPRQRHLQRAVSAVIRAVEPRPRTHEATVIYQADEARAVWVRIRRMRADLAQSRSNERELRINIEQAEEQLRRVGITPVRGSLQSTTLITHRRR